MNRKTPSIDLSAMPVAPLDVGRPAADQIYARLKAAILDTTLAPGRMISEAEVGHLFGASRTPVREGFTRLREDGLIITLPSRGTYVSKLSEQTIRGAQFLREALETAVVERLCARGLPDATAAGITAILDAQARAVAARDRPAFQSHDDAFHLALAEATGFDRVGPLLMREKAALDRLRVLSLNEEHHMPRLLGDHRAIFEAVAAGSGSQAVDRMRRHLRGILTTLSGLIGANRDYFE